MPESSSGLLVLNPDGTVGVTVGGVRHTLRQVTLDDLRDLRALYLEAQDSINDHIRFDSRPAIQSVQAEVAKAETRDEAQRLRAALNDARADQDRFVQGAWAGWWRTCLVTLSKKDPPDLDAEDPAHGFEPWMVDAKAGASISSLFGHWQAAPLGGSGGQMEALTNLLNG